MQTELEKTLAKRLLQLKRDGYTWRSIVIPNAKLLLIRGTALAFFGVWAFMSNFHPLMSVLTGIVLGSILRDIGWYRGIRLTFPFTVRVTDWPLVERIANDDVA